MAASPSIYRLDIESLFSSLNEREKLYSHYMARAAWSGTRIIFRQVSPESEAIFNLIMGLREFCGGKWDIFSDDDVDVDAFLHYAATFLSNVGNYYGSGDQKFIPKMSFQAMKTMASQAPQLATLFEKCKDMFTTPPYSLGFPDSSNVSQSAYYPGDQRINRDEIALVSGALDDAGVFPENTRLTKDGYKAFTVLQASVETAPEESLHCADSEVQIRLQRGDHAADLRRVCEYLEKAAEYAADETQRRYVSLCAESFRTGSLDTYREGQRAWVADGKPKVESIFGFVEPYRDPYGVRAEFEGLVAVAHAGETEKLVKLVSRSDECIRKLPWASAGNNGKGPFEKSLFDPPDLSSIHALAYCSSIIFPGINLPNYNDIRQDVGFKNVIVANRMVAESTAAQWPFVPEEEMEMFQKHKYPAYYWWVVLHELLGHGTGKMMMEESSGKFNFDEKNPPVSPLDGKPIRSWYKPGQTWTSQFSDLSTTVDECRCELVGAFLMDDPEVLELLGFTEEGDIKASGLTYNLYQQLGVDGLRGLANFNVESMTWGQAHSRAHFAMLTCLLRHSNGCVQVHHDEDKKRLTVYIDRSKIMSYGKKALGHMLLRLHMYRSTADVEACRQYYEDLSRVDEEKLGWRRTVLANKPPPLLNVQANTFLEGDTVTVKEYDKTCAGIVESWYERQV
ncbi:peptidase family M49-domain-containing protein [Poronia punctata]|nr:peptidase family M49-domain-containing protein [Poronia punctata]